MADIFALKKEIVEKLKKNHVSYIKPNQLQSIVDRIITSFIAYSIFKKIFHSEPFIDFLKNNIENLDKFDKIYELLNQNMEIENILNRYCSLSEDFEFDTISNFYEKMKSYSVEAESLEIVFNKADRKPLGIFYTHIDIVKYIIDKSFEDLEIRVFNLIGDKRYEEALVSLNNIRLIDISCGTGIFLVKSLDKFALLLKKILEKKNSDDKSNEGLNGDFNEIFASNLKNILFNSIFGIDIDKDAVLLSKYLLLNQLYILIGNDNFRKMIEPEYIKDLKIIAGDSILSYIEPKDIDIIRHFFPDSTNFYCYKTVFPSVFDRKDSGFNIILMNPPYGKVRIESNKGIYKQKIALDKDKEPLKIFSDFIRSSKLFPLSSYGVLNYYKLMIERAIQLLKRDGILGCIIPNTILCDLSTTELRKYLCDNMETRYLINIPEKSAFFTDVTQAFSIVISRNGGTTFQTKFKVNVLKPLDLLDNAYIDLDINYIRKNFPRNYNIPITDGIGLKIFYKLHNHPKLSEIPFLINARGEADLTIYKKFISPIPEINCSKLIRGIHIEKYGLNEDISKPSFIDKDGFLKALGESKKIEEIKKDRIICKQITNQNSKERLSFAYVPPNTILANSCNYITFNEKLIGNPKKVLDYLLGLLNSSILEWRFRITSTNNHVNNYELDDLPIAIPKIGSEKEKFIEEISQLVHKVKMNISFNDRNEILTQIDDILGKIYELEPIEMNYIYSAMKKKLK